MSSKVVTLTAENFDAQALAADRVAVVRLLGHLVPALPGPRPHHRRPRGRAGGRGGGKARRGRAPRHRRTLRHPEHPDRARLPQRRAGGAQRRPGADRPSPRAAGPASRREDGLTRAGAPACAGIPPLWPPTHWHSSLGGIARRKAPSGAMEANPVSRRSRAVQRSPRSRARSCDRARAPVSWTLGTPGPRVSRPDSWIASIQRSW